MAKILIAGGTGNLGSTIAHKLASEGHQVTGMSRNPQGSPKAAALAKSGVRLVQGDMKDVSSLEKALTTDDYDTIIATATSVSSQQPDNNVKTLDLEGTRNLIEAAVKKGVKRFVFVSFTHNVDSRAPLSEGKFENEKKLKGTSLDWTILQPSFFPETWLSSAVGFDVEKGEVRIYGDGQQPVSYIALEDVANAVVASVKDKSTVRKEIPLGGPQALTQLQVVAAVEKALGRKLNVSHMPLEAIQQMRQQPPDPLTASFLALFEGLAHGDEIPAGNLKTLTGKAGTPIAEWAKAHLK